MSLNSSTGSIISLQEAQEFIRNFRERYPTEIHALAVGSDLVNSVLEQEGCEGIRIYNGYNLQEQRLNSVLVGFDADGEDIIGIVVDDLRPCPADCGKKDILDK